MPAIFFCLLFSISLFIYGAKIGNNTDNTKNAKRAVKIRKLGNEGMRELVNGVRG